MLNLLLGLAHVHSRGPRRIRRIHAPLKRSGHRPTTVLPSTSAVSEPKPACATCREEGVLAVMQAQGIAWDHVCLACWRICKNGNEETY